MMGVHLFFISLIIQCTRISSTSTTFCEDGWTFFGGYCYKVVTDAGDSYNSLPWLNYNDLCETENTRAHLIVEPDNNRMKQIWTNDILPDYEYNGPGFIHIGATSFDDPSVVQWIDSPIPLMWRQCTEEDTAFDYTETGNCTRLVYSWASPLGSEPFCLSQVDCDGNDVNSMSSPQSWAVCQYYVDNFSQLCPTNKNWLLGPDGESCFLFEEAGSIPKSWNELYCESLMKFEANSTAAAVPKSQLADFQNVMELLWMRQHAERLVAYPFNKAAIIGLTNQNFTHQQWISGTTFQEYLLATSAHSKGLFYSLSYKFRPVKSTHGDCTGVVVDHRGRLGPRAKLGVAIQKENCVHSLSSHTTNPSIHVIRLHNNLDLLLLDYITSLKPISKLCAAVKRAASDSCVNSNGKKIDFSNCDMQDFVETTTVISTSSTSTSDIATSSSMISSTTTVPSTIFAVSSTTNNPLTSSAHLASTSRLFTIIFPSTFTSFFTSTLTSTPTSTSKLYSTSSSAPTSTPKSTSSYVSSSISTSKSTSPFTLTSVPTSTIASSLRSKTSSPTAKFTSSSSILSSSTTSIPSTSTISSIIVSIFISPSTLASLSPNSTLISTTLSSSSSNNPYASTSTQPPTSFTPSASTLSIPSTIYSSSDSMPSSTKSPSTYSFAVTSLPITSTPYVGLTSTLTSMSPLLTKIPTTTIIARTQSSTTATELSSKFTSMISNSPSSRTGSSTSKSSSSTSKGTKSTVLNIRSSTINTSQISTSDSGFNYTSSRPLTETLSRRNSMKSSSTPTTLLSSASPDSRTKISVAPSPGTSNRAIQYREGLQNWQIGLLAGGGALLMLICCAGLLTTVCMIIKSKRRSNPPDYEIFSNEKNKEGSRVLWMLPVFIKPHTIAPLNIEQNWITRKKAEQAREDSTTNPSLPSSPPPSYETLQRTKSHGSSLPSSPFTKQNSSFPAFMTNETPDMRMPRVASISRQISRAQSAMTHFPTPISSPSSFSGGKSLPTSPAKTNQHTHFSFENVHNPIHEVDEDDIEKLSFFDENLFGPKQD